MLFAHPRLVSQRNLPYAYKNMTEQRDLSSYGQLDKEALIEKILQLQQTLSDLTTRIDQVRNENLGLKGENSVLKEYINNLMVKTGNLPSQGS